MSVFRIIGWIKGTGMDEMLSSGPPGPRAGDPELESQQWWPGSRIAPQHREQQGQGVGICLGIRKLEF